jgi:hypothetical protein
LGVLGVLVFVTCGAALFARKANDHSAMAMRGWPIASEHLHDGDIVFRRGHDATSQAVLLADGTSQFSHVGILVKREGVAYVIHAVPAERPGRIDGVVMDTLSFFADPARADAVAVYRVKDLKAAKGLKVAQFAENMLGRPFDEKFDLSEQNHLYCTELVWAAYRSQGVLLISKPDVLHVPLLGEQFILPRTLFSSGLLQPVAQ